VQQESGRLAWRPLQQDQAAPMTCDSPTSAVPISSCAGCPGSGKGGGGVGGGGPRGRILHSPSSSKSCSCQGIGNADSGAIWPEHIQAAWETFT